MKVPGIPYIQGRNAYTDADGTKYGIAIHNTANDATAEGEASYATRRTDGVSAHFYCDRYSVVQSLDTTSRAGHAGSYEGNQHAVAVEITGTNDKPRSWWLDNVAWDQLGRVLAVVCRHYGIAVRRASVAEMRANPKVKAFYSHDDMRQAWGETTHTDPGPNFPWDRLFQAVQAALAGEDDDMSQAEVDAIKAHIDAQVRRLAHYLATGGPNTLMDPKALPWIDDAPTTTLPDLAHTLHEEGEHLLEIEDKLPGAAPELDYDKLAIALLRNMAAPPAPQG